MAEFKQVTCKVCKREGICPLGPGGALSFLPVGWERYEDKTLDRKSSMTEICSERCRAKLKELNRTGRSLRNGF